MTLAYSHPAYEPYKPRNWKCAQPHVIRNRIQRISYELKFALPATIPDRTQKPSAIVPYEPKCVAIIPYVEPQPEPCKIIAYPAVGRKSKVLPPYQKPVYTPVPNRQQRMNTFTAALNNPNMSTEDFINLSDELLFQAGFEAYHGA